MRATQTCQNTPTDHARGITKLGIPTQHTAGADPGFLKGGGGQIRSTSKKGGPDGGANFGSNVKKPTSWHKGGGGSRPPGPPPPRIRTCTGEFSPYWGQGSSRKQSQCGRHGLSNILKLQATFLYSIYHQRAPNSQRASMWVCACGGVSRGVGIRNAIRNVQLTKVFNPTHAMPLGAKGCRISIYPRHPRVFSINIIISISL